MRCTNYFALFCPALAYCHDLSLPQATPLPHKRTFENLTSHDNELANVTANALGNGTAGKFDMKFAAGGGTITMDVGPLSAFTQTTTSIATPAGTGYVILPTDYPESGVIPPGGIYVVFYKRTSEDLLEKYKAVCVPSDISDPACIEGIGAVVEQHAPDLEKRFFRAASRLLSLAVEALVIALIAHLFTYLTSTGHGTTPLPAMHYKESVLSAAEAAQNATGASVILVETGVGDTQAITIGTAELTAFIPSPTTSASSSGTPLLTSDSSGHFVLQIQATDMPALQSFESALTGPARFCNLMSPLIERDVDEAEVYFEASCLANQLMYNDQGLNNPNGLMKTFQHQVVEVAEQLPPNFVPNFPDLRTAAAFAIFLGTGFAIVSALFPGPVVYLLVAAFVSFLLGMTSIASNTVDKLQQSSDLTQIVLQVTKEEFHTESICLPDNKSYDCEGVWCDGDNNVCTGYWTFGCPCCPSAENMLSCNDCNSANPTNGTCATPNPGCPCYVATTQNSNQVDPVYEQLALQIWNSLPTWNSNTTFPSMAGVTCRPDNSWYGNCKYPDTSKGSDFGSYPDFEGCLTSFNTPGTPQSVNLDKLVDGPNPTWPPSGRMGQGSSNVTMICPISGNEVMLIINVAFADGCITDTTYNGQVSILDPVGDGSINGLDLIRGTWYGCQNMAASYNPSTRIVDMVPGSAGQGQDTPNPPAEASLTVYPGASNLGVGGWNQVGCLIYETIPTKNTRALAVNQNTVKPWFWGSNWDQYLKFWPTLAETYYSLGSYYCPKPPVLNLNAAPPCAAFPCPLGSLPTDIPSAVGDLIAVAH